jgi:hypothetical protein
MERLYERPIGIRPLEPGEPPPAAEDAFGRPVPTVRQVAALDCAVEQMGVDPMLADPVIRTAASYIERDAIHNAVTVLQNIVDLTGAYRLVAVMCTDEPS